MDWEYAFQLYVTLIVSLTFHEAAHAWLAMLGGDRTAFYAGQVTLNPIAHMRREPFGTIVLPLLMLLSSNGQSVIGSAHAPSDPRWAARNPRKAALMSAGGPLANLLLVAIASLAIYLVGRPIDDTDRAIRTIADLFLRINLLLAIFNLMPLPPLDGVGIVRGLVPASEPLFRWLESIPYIALVVFVLSPYWLYPLWHDAYYALDRLQPHPIAFR